MQCTLRHVNNVWSRHQVPELLVRPTTVSMVIEELFLRRRSRIPVPASLVSSSSAIFLIADATTGSCLLHPAVLCPVCEGKRHQGTMSVSFVGAHFSLLDAMPLISAFLLSVIRVIITAPSPSRIPLRRLEEGFEMIPVPLEC